MLEIFKNILAQVKLIATTLCDLAAQNSKPCQHMLKVLMFRLDSDTQGTAIAFTEVPNSGKEGNILTFTQPYKYLSVTFLKGTPENSRVEVNEIGYISGSCACAEGYGTSIPDFPMLQSGCYGTPVTIKAFDGAKIEVMIIV
jgi:hypothetical protein